MIENLKKAIPWVFSGIGVYMLSFIIETKLKAGDTVKSELEILEPSKFNRVGMSNEVVDSICSDKVARISRQRDELVSSYIEMYNNYMLAYLKRFDQDEIQEFFPDIQIELLVSRAVKTVKTNDNAVIDFVVSPMNYSRLFEDQTKYGIFQSVVSRYEFRIRQDFENLYLSYEPLIKDGLRKYFAKPSNLKEFYEVNKSSIIGAIGKVVPYQHKEELISNMDQSISSFELILDINKRDRFLRYIELESEVLNSTTFAKDWQIHGLQNMYDSLECCADLLGKYYSGDIDKKSQFLKARAELYTFSQHPKSTAFAFRRYQEGGEQLVSVWIDILVDLRHSID